MQTAVSTLSGVWRGCEDYGFERPQTSYASSAPSYWGSAWTYDAGPPTPPRASRHIHEAPVLPTRGRAGGGSSSSTTCDKCDGAHETSACPHFKGARDTHKDAWGYYSGAAGAGMAHLKARECFAPRELSRSSASVVRMPGDGSCLFHSIAYGLKAFGCNEDGHSIRRRTSQFIAQKPDFEISGTPLRSWVDWDSQQTISGYVSRLSGGSFWGGGIEMAACAQIFGVDVAVYEEDYYGSGFRRISDFICDNQPRGCVLIVYRGRAHYDALVAHEPQASTSRNTGYSAGRQAQPAYSDQEEDDSICSIM